MGVLGMNDSFFESCVGFDWDEFNQEKSFKKHGVNTFECEQVFFNVPLLLFQDEKHSLLEKRLYVLGQTDFGKQLCIVFTVRGKLIRVISARSMSKKERAIYEKQ
jgi:uncharacterized DUF497 family protein